MVVMRAALKDYGLAGQLVFSMADRLAESTDVVMAEKTVLSKVG